MEKPVFVSGLGITEINKIQYRADMYKMRLREYSKAVNQQYAKTQGTKAPCTTVPFREERLGEYYAERCTR